MVGYTSFFDLFSIGIGPSSSHTVGPMRAAKLFSERMLKLHQSQSDRILIQLHGSLALTGEGHGTPKALILGLQGYTPEDVPVHQIPSIIEEVKSKGSIRLCFGANSIPFSIQKDIVFEPTKLLPLHSNGMRFMAFDRRAEMLACHHSYSIGGGFLRHENESEDVTMTVPYSFESAKDLLERCRKHELSIAEVVWRNECSLRSPRKVQEKLAKIWDIMCMSIENGINSQESILPGVLKVSRRAPRLSRLVDPKHIDDLLSLYAIAVNEENAAGGRVVTAPTNGAAGIIPAVLKAFLKSQNVDSVELIQNYLLTCSAIGSLYKRGASISAAEVGCQGEVGVACSMAAAGLASVMGGSPEQIENAAEIAMEHCLGLTCDPIAGLVQIPCIERNAIGAAKAWTSARLALKGEGKHHVSLDTVIATMMQTGRDMQSKYKETSLGGLAVNQPLC